MGRRTNMFPRAALSIYVNSSGAQKVLETNAHPTLAPSRYYFRKQLQEEAPIDGSNLGCLAVMNQLGILRSPP